MERVTDSEQSKLYYKVDRFVQQNGEWFYITREGDERGPFESRSDAQGDLVDYLRHMHKMAEFGQ